MKLWSLTRDGSEQSFNLWFKSSLFIDRASKFHDLLLQESQGRELALHVEEKHKPDCRNILGFDYEIINKICAEINEYKYTLLVFCVSQMSRARSEVQLTWDGRTETKRTEEFWSMLEVSNMRGKM